MDHEDSKENEKARVRACFVVTLYIVATTFFPQAEHELYSAYTKVDDMGRGLLDVSFATARQAEKRHELGLLRVMLKRRALHMMSHCICAITGVVVCRR